MDLLFSLCVGLGLSAACGFRVFVPMFIMSIAHQTGHLELAQNFQWVGSEAACLTFGIATAFEVGAYYFPWVDNLLDTVASPAAVVAGVIASGAVAVDLDPMMQWSVALIAGGGTAATTQASFALIRSGSSMMTLGMGNAVVSTTEWMGALFLSALAILLPILAFFIVLTLFGAGLFLFLRWRKKQRLAQSVVP
jgi:hypothetical protein